MGDYFPGSVPQVNRPPTREEFEKALDERTKQNIYGGATDLSPTVLGMLMSPTLSQAAQQVHPAITAGIGALFGGLRPGKYEPTNETINNKSMTPDLKYLKKLETEKEKAKKKALELAALEALQNKKAY